MQPGGEAGDEGKPPVGANREPAATSAELPLLSASSGGKLCQKT
jgi:hypothetical protein